LTVSIISKTLDTKRLEGLSSREPTMRGQPDDGRFETAREVVSFNRLEERSSRIRSFASDPSISPV
ncbi:MAG: hypothetical protein WBF29_17995, partial [Syntrophobacteria bacterium]